MRHRLCLALGAAALLSATVVRAHDLDAPGSRFLVRALEAVVNARANPVLRLTGLFDPGRYFWAVFGEPPAAPWAFRFEGHHLSLNVTVTPDGVSTTPLFIGAQPRVVPDGLDVGPPAGTAVLGEEERLARTLYASLDDAQRGRATLPYEDDRGLTIGQVARVEAPQQPVGIARGALDASQRELLDALAGSLAGLWAPDIAAARRAEIAAATEALHFAFAAAEEPPNSFYVRVSAPALLIEIDNTEGGDHVHAVWHRPGGDFGDDLLARHLAEDHGITLVRRPLPRPRHSTGSAARRPRAVSAMGVRPGAGTDARSHGRGSAAPPPAPPAAPPPRRAAAPSPAAPTAA